MQHLASIDFEDWYHDVEHVSPVDGDAFKRAFDRQVACAMDVLRSTSTRATFFVLGRTAERHPGWVRDIAAAGHEIATHGYGHERVTSLTPAQFRADVRRSVDVIAGITGTRPVGYRAPFFSVTAREAAWLYDILADEGFSYSSSVSPGRASSFSDHALAITPVTTSSGRTIVEAPLSAVEWRGRRLPFAGGGLWRALPLPIIARGIRRLEREHRAMVIYLHPHEFDPLPLRSDRGMRRNLYVNFGRASIADKLRAVLREFRFQPLGKALAT